VICKNPLLEMRYFACVLNIVRATTLAVPVHHISLIMDAERLHSDIQSQLQEDTIPSTTKSFYQSSEALKSGGTSWKELETQ